MNAKLRPLLSPDNARSGRAGRFSMARLTQRSLAFLAFLAIALANSQIRAAETATAASEPASSPDGAPAENLPPDTAPAAASLEAFKMIVERNIFNANRRALSAAPPPAEPPKKIESFSLAGTLLDDQTGHYAFFSGSDSSLNRVLQPGERIAGLKLVSIQIDAVKLETEAAAPIDLPMGMQLRREDEGPWQVIAGGISSSSRSAMSRPDDRGRSDSDSRSGRRDRGSDSESGGRTGRRERGSSSESSNSNAATESRPSDETGGGSSTDEILKRLMQQRQQELNRR